MTRESFLLQQEMKERAHRFSPDIRQIDLDVNRTYRNHIMFRKRYDVKYVLILLYLIYNAHGVHHVQQNCVEVVSCEKFVMVHLFIVISL